MMTHHRNKSGFKTINGKSYFFSYVEKNVEDDKKPKITDFVAKKEEGNTEENKQQFLAEVTEPVNSGCGCFR